ncbi:hypothetical protein LshimejAT787_0411720 [Lyophyllum shimeji]|uniref:Yeast cell wall synthesis Kre9/Knh1-like N-terminal domain-containing protein n=1 Tax=Lyophyllum shimeji TaxID=47721 RepID=A0A9P3PLY9_LYOSH|nr:hypothetical protein LshimejAT787_0411720 [Lyophyllum shimeji]
MLTLASPLTLASAVTLHPPFNTHVGGAADVTWVNSPADPPSWNLFLMNISTSFDLKANFGVIDPRAQTVKVTIPSYLRPSDDYVLYATNVSNWDQVLGSSGRFTILP